MKNRITCRSDCTDCILELGSSYRLTISYLGRTAQKVFDGLAAKDSGQGETAAFLGCMKIGTETMQQIGELRAKSIIITIEEAYHALGVCCFLTSQSSLLTPRLKSMLREAISIFAECCPAPVQIAYVPPFVQLERKVQKVSAVARHYPGIEAVANLNLKAYMMSLADARELLEAVQKIPSIKMVLLRKALEQVTEGVRLAIANLDRRKL